MKRKTCAICGTYYYTKCRQEKNHDAIIQHRDFHRLYRLVSAAVDDARARAAKEANSLPPKRLTRKRRRVGARTKPRRTWPAGTLSLRSRVVAAIHSEGP